MGAAKLVDRRTPTAAHRRRVGRLHGRSGGHRVPDPGIPPPRFARPTNSLAPRATPRARIPEPISAFENPGSQVQGSSGAAWEGLSQQVTDTSAPATSKGLGGRHPLPQFEFEGVVAGDPGTASGSAVEM
ncbi:hypothetical protein GCM10009612_51550 [Streptomyces beijiangensis]